MLDPAPIRDHKWDERVCAALFVAVWLGIPAAGMLCAYMGW
jgi:hypothetical protein